MISSVFLKERKKKQPTRYLGLYNMSFFHILCKFLKGLIALDISEAEELL